MNESFSYLTNNYSSGISAFVVTNSVQFSADDPVLIGQFGSETSEIGYVSSVDTETNTITLENETNFAHPESTRVSKLRYSMVEWLWGDGPDFAALGSVISQDVPSLLGDSTTEWTITQVSGRTKYTWVGETDPRISDYFSYPLPSAGSFTQRAWIYSPNFNASNNVTTQIGAEIYEVGEDYFILNFAGGTDTSEATGTGYIKLETTYMDVTADNFYTIFRDQVLVTGFGYFRWWNPREHIGTVVDSPIPYAGFPPNCAKTILDDFYSTLNNKELKLISRDDAFRWLSEGYSVAMNELNLVNKEYEVVTPFAITTVDGTQEYALPRNFSRIISVWNGAVEVSAIRQSAVESFGASSATEKPAYYLRGVKDLEIDDADGNANAEMYIGFSPTPSAATTYTIRYLPKAVRLVKNYDAVFLPNNEFYCLKDYMMFRAAPKLNRGNGANEFQLFNASVQRMKITSHKQNNHLDAFGISPYANV